MKQGLFLNSQKINNMCLGLVLINKEAIAVNQDSLGIQGFKFSTKDSIETWFKPLKNGEWAVCFLNRSLKPVKMEFDWSTKVYDDFAKRDLNAAQVSKNE